MDSLQTGGFTNSEFSCGLHLCKHTNTRHLRRHQRTTPANDLCFVPSVTKKQTLAEWTANGFAMASWLNLTKNPFTYFYKHHSEEPSSPSLIWSFMGASKMQFKMCSKESCMLPQPQNKCILRQLSLEWYVGQSSGSFYGYRRLFTSSLFARLLSPSEPNQGWLWRIYLKKGQKPQQTPFSIPHSLSLTNKFPTTPQRTLKASNLPLLFT